MMGGGKKKGVNSQIKKCKGKAPNSIIDNWNYADVTNGINTNFGASDFSRKGTIFQDGILASLNSFEGPSSSKTITESGILCSDKKLDQGNNASKKSESSTDYQATPSSFEKHIKIEEIITSSGKKPVEITNENLLCFLVESVLSIDLIRESIFSELDRKTLFECRLISHQWAYFGAKALQKTVNVELELNPEIAPYYHCKIKHNTDLSLKKLTVLINQSAKFPSTTFSFWNTYNGTLNPKPFFKAQGLCIKKLRFAGWVSLNDVKRLLFNYAPNLEQLLLTNFHKQMRCGPSVYTTYTPPTEPTKNAGSHIDGAINILPNPTLPNLKVFKCDEHIPTLFVQHILEWSPNLVEVVLPGKYLEALVKPVNRLHLLKELQTDFFDYLIEALECVANQHKDNLALERINFRYAPDAHKDPVKYQRAVDVMSKILTGSSKTCQRLVLHYKFDIKIQQMPRVTHLTIYSYHGDSDRSSVVLYQRCMRLGEFFPNLKSLNFVLQGNFSRVNTLFGGIVLAQVMTVRNVSFSYQPQDIVLQVFEKMFPNATIHTHRFELDWTNHRIAFK